MDDQTVLHNYSLIIRPHPRSNIKVLNNLFPDAIIDNNDVIKKPVLCISHNSSIISLFLNKNVRCILYRINEEEIPNGLIDKDLTMEISKLDKEDYFKINSFKNKKLIIKKNLISNEKISQSIIQFILTNQ